MEESPRVDYTAHFNIELYDASAYFKEEAFCNSEMLQVPFHLPDAPWAGFPFGWVPPKGLGGESCLGT